MPRPGRMAAGGGPLLTTHDHPGKTRAGTSTVEPGLAIGGIVTELPELLGLDGKPVSLNSRGQDTVLVLAFLGNACPAVKACIGSLNALQVAFAARGVRVVAVNSNNPYLSPQDSLAEMDRWATERGIRVPYLKDMEGAFARRMGITNTPQFAVLDGDGRLRYRGRMFDSRDPARSTTRDLEDAVTCVLTGLPVKIPETHPLGCSIVW